MGLNSYEIVVTPSAESDVDEILDYITDELCNAEAAQSFFDKLLKGFDRIAAFPYAMPVLRCALLQENANLRRMDIDNFVVIYCIDQALCKVHILAVFYAVSEFMYNLIRRIE